MADFHLCRGSARVHKSNNLIAIAGLPKQQWSSCPRDPEDLKFLGPGELCGLPVNWFQKQRMVNVRRVSLFREDAPVNLTTLDRCFDTQQVLKAEDLRSSWEASNSLVFELHRAFFPYLVYFRPLQESSKNGKMAASRTPDPERWRPGACPGPGPS